MSNFSQQHIAIIDVGSTTTKALLFTNTNGSLRLTDRGEAPTTVEEPTEDVLVGVAQAVHILERRTGLNLSSGNAQNWQPLTSEFLATSSAGGGLLMVVCGNVMGITGLTARKAALGAGAVLLDVFATDDGRHHFHRLEQLRTLRPDMILLSGGVEGARNLQFVTEMCDFIRAAKPRSKFSVSNKLPIVYSGASSAVAIVEDLLGDDFHVVVAENLRPTFQNENITPTRDAIHDLFINHVMAHAPGYDKLQALTTAELMPTPSAVGEILNSFAKNRSSNILCIDIGGATTDVFSFVKGNYVRTVSANYGMSYSIGNVATICGWENIYRWLPKGISAKYIQKSIGTKMINPTMLPAHVDDLTIEQAIAREAIRLAYSDHLEVAKTHKPRAFFINELPLPKPQPISMGDIDIVIGSGGVLSNAPLRGQAAAILIDALQPLGVTELFVDSVFMLSHLGMLASRSEVQALSILEKDCLVPLGTSLNPIRSSITKSSELHVAGWTTTRRRIIGSAKAGDLTHIPLAADEQAEITISAKRCHWVAPSRVEVRGGTCGLILDMRSSITGGDNRLFSE